MTSVLFVNNNWYLFFRLHQILCNRLHQIYQQAVRIAEEEAKCKRERKESTAIALRLKAPSKYDGENAVSCSKWDLPPQNKSDAAYNNLLQYQENIKV